jgi:predicted Rossmann-fold nucleotide-binding protein
MKKISKKRPIHIAFFGDSAVTKKSSQFVDAYDTAQLLAGNKYTIINGGGSGIMLASTLGAKSINGRVETVVVNSKNQPPKHYEGQNPDNISQSNRVFILKSYQGRLNKLIKLANAYVIFYGGTGTLAEMSYVWSEAKFAFPKQKPIIFFGKKWQKIIHTLSQELNLEKIEQRICYFVDKPEQVLDIIKTYSKVNSKK